jgi:hypothetical protein
MKMVSEKRAIDKIFRRRDRYDTPDWQRQEVWNREKKQRLIDSILRGWKLPKFYFIEGSGENYLVEDGQQRLNAIWEFFSNELSLSAESAKQFRGRFYRDLPRTVADSFDDFEINFDIISGATDAELKEFFQRLQEGMPLTSSEKLNAVPSKLTDYCRTTANHRFSPRRLRSRIRATRISILWPKLRPSKSRGSMLVCVLRIFDGSFYRRVPLRLRRPSGSASKQPSTF